jgi:hypothetical protein
LAFRKEKKSFQFKENLTFAENTAKQPQKKNENEPTAQFQFSAPHKGDCGSHDRLRAPHTRDSFFEKPQRKTRGNMNKK